MDPPHRIPGVHRPGGSTLRPATGGTAPRKNGAQCAVLHLRTRRKGILMNYLEDEVKKSREGGLRQLRRAGVSFKAGQRPGECSSAGILTGLFISAPGSRRY